MDLDTQIKLAKARVDNNREKVERNLRKVNTKELIRRIILAPFWLILSPLAWLILSGTSYKEVWGDFLEITEDSGSTESV